MKNTIYILILSLLMTNCSSESNDNENSNPFSINLTPSVTSVVVDQAFTISISATEEIKELWVSTDNFATGGYAQRQFGTSYILNFNFDTLGQKTISVRAKNQNNVVSEKQVVISVSRGNALKINGVQVISFYGINTTYDSEFPATNPNHLADLRFGLSKNKLGNPLDNIYSPTYWYLSNVIDNQGSMTWDCSNDNLYLNPNAPLKFGLVDIDNGIAGADLLNGPPDYREISFTNYLVTKPTTITYTFPEINLEFKVFVEWAN
ncbi:hypothetical protein WFZ85_06830 [Flavobacterium sp. j3]|uniref:PKD/Chitinase domain-containing protein n=1 Tax=Flavobacterium aureirubrum TaxID=3133147 RepID=A0ABU9N3M6_9FLAO